MKKVFWFILLLIVEQTLFSQNLKIGIDFNPGASWMTAFSKNANTNGGAFSYSLGLNMEYYFSKNYAFNLGLSIGNQKGKLKFEDSTKLPIINNLETIDKTDLELKENYINVPIGIKLRTNSSNSISFYSNLGFNNQFIIKTNAKVIDENGNVLFDDFLESSDIKSYNLNAFIGLGIEKSISEDTAIKFGVLYQNGLMSIFKNDPEVYFNILSLSIGIIF